MGDINCNNVYFLSYNAIISGSIELRALNQNYTFPTLKSMDKQNLTRIGKYALIYDDRAGGGKLDEPNYDGITSCIALLDDEQFNNSFTYRKVKLDKTEGSWGNSHFLGSQPDTVKLCMIQENDTFYNREDIFKTDYASGYKHIFILGPLSGESLDQVSTIMKNATEEQPVVIHYQGEGTLATKSHEGTVQPLPVRNDEGATEEYKDFFGLTPKGGLFASSFNWVGGMKHGRILRNALENCKNCYTVCIANSTEVCDETLQELIHNLDSSKGLVSEMNLPQIYKYINDYILNTIYSYGNNKDDLSMVRFSDVTVVQDLYDKDNSTALEIIARHTDNRMNTILVGREIGKIVYNGTEATSINRRVTELASGKDTNKKSPTFGETLPENDIGEISRAVPPYIKPNDFPTGVFFTLLNFFCGPGCPTWSTDGSYWPGFKNAALTQEIDHLRTTKENNLMAKAILHMLSYETREKIKLVGTLDNRTSNSIAMAGNESGTCFPFNELLFVPGLLYALDIINNTNTYSKQSISTISTMKHNILEDPLKYIPGHKRCRGRKLANCNAPCIINKSDLCREGTNITKARSDRSKKMFYNIRQTKFRPSTVQLGGGYEYIVNPVTGRHVKIYSKLGQGIIRKYINAINSIN